MQREADCEAWVSLSSLQLQWLIWSLLRCEGHHHALGLRLPGPAHPHSPGLFHGDYVLLHHPVHPSDSSKEVAGSWWEGLAPQTKEDLPSCGKCSGWPSISMQLAGPHPRVTAKASLSWVTPGVGALAAAVVSVESAPTRSARATLWVEWGGSYGSWKPDSADKSEMSQTEELGEIARELEPNEWTTGATESEATWNSQTAWWQPGRSCICIIKG